MIELRSDSTVTKTITAASVIVLAAVMFVTAGSFFSAGVFAPMAAVQTAEATVIEPEHGAGLTKVCNKVVVGSVDNCTMTAFNLDGFLDSLTITEICDTKNAPFPGAPSTKCFTLDPGFSIISFTNGSGLTTCEVGGSLPCVMGPGDSVRFRTQAHTMSTAGTFSDTAEVTTEDNCDGNPAGLGSCPTAAQFATAGSQQTVINPDIDVVKSLNTTKVLPGDPIEVTANVTNTGSVTLTGLTAIDTEAGALVCGDTELDPDESTLCTGTFNPVASGTNTVNATANHQLGSVSDEDSEDFTVIEADMTVVKSLNTTKVLSGQPIEVTANVTNTGTTTLSGLTAVDTEAGALVCGDTELDPDESTLCTGTFNPVADGTNTVNATANVQIVGSISRFDSEDFRVIRADITVDKTCDPETQTEPGTITTIINTTNTGNVALDVTVEDDVFGITFQGSLAPGESNVTTIVQNDLPAGNYSNTVNATGEFQLGSVQALDSEFCIVEPGGNEGLTPGFWKANAEKFDAVAWEVEDPGDDFNTVFGTSISIRIGKTIISDPTLLEALSSTGGVNEAKGVYDALARHCVAAKLNSENSNIEYPMSTAEVIDACSDAITNADLTDAEELKDLLDTQNNLGGGVDQHNNPI